MKGYTSLHKQEEGSNEESRGSSPGNSRGVDTNNRRTAAKAGDASAAGAGCAEREDGHQRRVEGDGGRWSQFDPLLRRCPERQSVTEQQFKPAVADGPRQRLRACDRFHAAGLARLMADVRGARDRRRGGARARTAEHYSAEPGGAAA